MKVLAIRRSVLGILVISLLLGVSIRFGPALLAQAQEKKAEKKTEKKPSDEKKKDAPGIPQPGPEVEAMMAAGTPGEQHKVLAKLAGRWNIEGKAASAPGAAAEDTKGSLECRMILGGRYLEQEIHGDYMGKEYRGRGYLGYDNTKKQFVATWMDNMSTGIFVTSGTADASGKVITLIGSMEDPASKKPKKLKTVLTILSDDKYRDEAFEVGDDGKELKMMELTYTRSAGGKTEEKGKGKRAGDKGAPKSE